ncbi:MAG TPA: TRAP transporter substrate-binding protein DctP [Croceibacterium sp.]|nr:TRAP transporter substrate-binding protein DctP [Croceibacterium sp.]
MTRSKPVRKLADLRGMRIRAPTELLAVLSGLGADPVNMPMGEVYSALAKGVIDGVVAPPDTLRALHLVEVANYFYELRVPRGAYPARAMSAKRWRSLEEWQQALLQRSKPVWEAALADEIRRSEAVGREAGKGKITFSLPDPVEQQRFDEVYLKDAAVNARRLQRFGIDGPAAFRLARNSVVGRDSIKCGGVS